MLSGGIGTQPVDREVVIARITRAIRKAEVLDDFELHSEFKRGPTSALDCMPAQDVPTGYSTITIRLYSKPKEKQ